MHIQDQLSVHAKMNREPSVYLIRKLLMAARLANDFEDFTTADKHNQQIVQFVRRLTYANGTIISAYTNYADYLKSHNRTNEAEIILAESSRPKESAAH